MSQILKFYGDIPQFFNALRGLGITAHLTPDVAPDGVAGVFSIDLEQVKQLGFDPRFFQDVQDPASKDNARDFLTREEQQRIARIYQKITEGYKERDGLAEFRRLTTFTTSPWAQDDNKSLAYESCLQMVASVSQIERIRDMVSSGGIAGVAFNTEKDNGGGRALYHSRAQTSCPVDKTRLDLYHDVFLRPSNLPEVQHQTAASEFFFVVKFADGQTFLGSAAHLGKGLALTARHNLYKNDNSSEEPLGYAFFAGALEDETPFANPLPPSSKPQRQGKGPVEILWEDEESDLALIKVTNPDISSLPAATLPKKGVVKIKKGEPVYHTGTPGIGDIRGIKYSSVGYVTHIVGTELYTTAISETGSSGGVLTNANGELVAIATHLDPLNFETAIADDQGATLTIASGDEEFDHIYQTLPKDIRKWLRAYGLIN